MSYTSLERGAEIFCSATKLIIGFPENFFLLFTKNSLRHLYTSSFENLEAIGVPSMLLITCSESRVTRRKTKCHPSGFVRTIPYRCGFPEKLGSPAAWNSKQSNVNRSNQANPSQAAPDSDPFRNLSSNQSALPQQSDQPTDRRRIGHWFGSQTTSYVVLQAVKWTG